MKKYVRLMRVHHYVKNLLVFLPLALAGGLFQWPEVGRGLLAFCAFSLLSSVIYIIGDIRDARDDRQTEEKKDRPLATGEVSVRQAAMLACILLVCAVFLQDLAARNVRSAWLQLAAYFLLNVLYSVWLKKLAVADIAALAGGFMLRVSYGAAVTETTIGGYFLLAVTALALYMAVVMRRNTFLLQGDGPKVTPALYTQPFLDQMMILSMGLTLAFYGIGAANSGLSWSALLLLLVLMRHNMMVHQAPRGDLVRAFLSDKPQMALWLAYIIVTLLIIYL